MKNVIVYRDNDTLQHHGILGQKWGVRRYQNPDGSYTEAGLLRYGRKFNKESKKGGYRREQDLPAKTLPKGLKVYRTSMGDGDVSGAKAVYITTNKPDAKRVRGIVDWMAEKSGKSIEDYSEKEYRLTEDLKIPSMKEMREVQDRLFRNKELRSKAIKEYTANFQTPEVQDLLKHGKDSKYYEQLASNNTALADSLKAVEKLRKTRLAELKASFDNDAQQKAQTIIDALKDKKITELDSKESIAAKTILDFGVGSSETYKEALIDELAKRGYNAMYDNGMMRSGSNESIPVWNRDSYGNMLVTYQASQEAYEPIIVFNGSSLSSPVKVTKNMTSSENSYRRNVDVYNMRLRSQSDMDRWKKVQGDPDAYKKQKSKDAVGNAVAGTLAAAGTVALAALPLGMTLLL